MMSTMSAFGRKRRYGVGQVRLGTAVRHFTPTVPDYMDSCVNPIGEH